MALCLRTLINLVNFRKKDFAVAHQRHPSSLVGPIGPNGWVASSNPLRGTNAFKTLVETSSERLGCG
jgi:hypothetical protein